MSMKNTHGEFISLNIGDDKVNAFIDGVPDDCNHDWDGEGYYIVSFIGGGGDEYIKPPASRDEYEKLDAEYRKAGRYISGGCVSCSKCGKPFSPDIHSI